MNPSEKRRRTRVQGGWATKDPTTSKIRSDAHKPEMPKAPAWLAKNADASNLEKFTYEEPVDDLKQKPKEKVIDKTGVYDISTSNNGLSRIRLFSNFIEPSECKHLYEQLFCEIPWKQKSDTKNGETYLQPRLTAWFGDFPYSYSGVTHQANIQWTPSLRVIKERLEENVGLKFNSMLANLYRDGHDLVAWHWDNEPELRKNPVIASLSFGDTRMFELRKKPPPGEDPTDFTYMEHLKIPLEAGSLLIMEGATQADWQHRIPREYHDRGPRINLTFRIIFQD